MGLQYNTAGSLVGQPSDHVDVNYLRNYMDGAILAKKGHSE